MLSVWDFGHINNVFHMKTTLFNAGESYITALTKSNIFVYFQITGKFISEQDGISLF